MATVYQDAYEQKKVTAWELLIAFILPLSQTVSVHVGGTIFGQDILAMLLLPFLLSQRGARERLRPTKTFFALLLVWLFGQVVTDIIRGSAPEDFLRGWLKIVFFGIQFAALWLFLTRNSRLFVIYMLGLGLALLLLPRLLGPPFSEFPWKFGLGTALIMLAAVISSQLYIGSREGRSLGRAAAPILIGGAAVLALLHNARNVFGIGALSALYVVVAGYAAASPRWSRAVTPANFLILVVVGLFASQALISTYGFVAGQGLLGPEAQAKYEEQSSGDVSVIQGGRVESMVSTIAIADSPIIGHGSWAHDRYYTKLLAQKLYERGLTRGPVEEVETDLIPTHSHFFGAWVEAGIAGAIFWGWVLIVCGMALFQLLKMPGNPSPIVILSAFSMLWDIPFSPFGAEVRFTRAAQIALLLYTIEMARRQRRRPVSKTVPARPRFV